MLGFHPLGRAPVSRLADDSPFIATGAATYSPVAAGVATHDTLFSGLQDEFSAVTAPMRLTVRGTGDVSAPMLLRGSPPHGDVVAPMRLTVRGTGDVTAPMRLTKLGTSRRWRHAVFLGDVDVTSRITGEVWDEMNEEAAHVASFTLIPAAGSINPFVYVGASVTIDHVMRETSGNVSRRRFTGVVEVPEYNPADGTIAFTCTDNVQLRVNNLPRAVLYALIGGRFHASVHGEPANNWEYARALMSTLQASLDCKPSGAITVTPWQGLALHKTFTLDNTLEGSITLELPRRSSLVNQITATFEYRYSRLHRRTAHIRYNMQLEDAVNNALPLLARSTVEAALGSTGWDFFYGRGIGASGGGGLSNIGRTGAAVSPATPVIHYTPYPEVYHYPFSDAIWSQNETDTTCMGFQASLYRRFAQTVTETYTLTVKAPESIEHNGVIAREDSASLASEWDANAWESDADASPRLDSTAQFETLDYAPDVGTADRDAAIETFVDTLKVQVSASHRTARAGATVLLDTSIDLTREERIATAKVTAQGKVVYVRHRSNMDAGAGYALTDFKIAISGHGATGLPEVSETGTAAPAAPTAAEITSSVRERHGLNLGVHIGGLEGSPEENADWQGWVVNVQSSVNVTDPGADSYTVEGEVQSDTGYTGDYSNPNFVPEKAYQNTGFRLVLPEVEAAARDNLSLAVSQTYEIPIPEDELSLSA
jgi:hypothetical protein